MFLHEWLVLAWNRLPRTDYAAVVVILGVIAFSGYFQGVMIGLLIATLLFVVNYSRVRIVTHSLSGVEQRSHVDRAPVEQAFLQEEGGRIQIFRLQGFLFFGSASGLLVQVRERLAEPGLPVEFLVLDFARVYGLDSSAVLSLRKLRDLAAASGAQLLLCGVSDRLLEQMRRSGMETGGETGVGLHADRDHALEWCEDRLLARHRPAIATPEIKTHLAARLESDWPPGPVRPDALLPYLQRLEVEAERTIIHQGDPSGDFYFLEQGRLTARTGGGLRLRRMNAGAVVGELGFYLGGPRTADIVADVPCVLYRMDAEGLARMQAEQPALAEAFHRFMLRLMAARLVATSRTLQMVLE